MRGFIPVTQHLQPGSLILNPANLVGLLDRFTWGIGLNALTGEESFECLPVEFDNEFETLNGAVDDEAVAIWLVQRLFEAATPAPKVSQALLDLLLN